MAPRSMTAKWSPSSRAKSRYCSTSTMDIGRAIAYLRSLGKIAIVLVEQYLDFARELGDHFAVMERGAIVYSCNRDNLDEGALLRAMAI